MNKQNKFTDSERTKQLRDIGLTSENESGFQIHELLNFIPKNIVFKKTYHRDGTVFIDWKRKTRFFIRISNFLDSWGYDLASYNNHKESDQGQSGNQFVDLLADMLIYINRQKLKVK